MNHSPALSSISNGAGATTPKAGSVYAQAQEKAKSMQYAIRSGRPGGEPKLKRKCYAVTMTDEEMEAAARGPGIKKPNVFDRSERKEGSHALPVTPAELAVTWIPARGRSASADWIKTITVKDLLRQLKAQKVKLLIDLDDESFLNMEEDMVSDSDINMK